MFCKKCALRNFAKFKGKDLYQSVFFNKGAGLRQVTLAQVFSCEFYEIFKNTFLIEHLRRLLLLDIETETLKVRVFQFWSCFMWFFSDSKLRSSHRRCSMWPQACNFIKKETLTQVFSCEFCESFKNTFFYRTPLVDASELYRLLQTWLTIVGKCLRYLLKLKTYYVLHFDRYPHKNSNCLFSKNKLNCW